MSKKKTKYVFDQKSLSFKIKHTTLNEKIKTVSFSVGFGLVMAVVFIVVIYFFIDSPKEKILKRQVQNYERQYDVLNKEIENLSEILHVIESRDKDVYRVIFEAEPSEINYDKLTNKNSLILSSELNTSNLIINTSKKVDQIAKRLYLQSKSFDEVFPIAKSKKERMTCMPAILPISHKASNLVSGFGSRFHPILQIRRMHTGIDFSAKTGTPVYATADGVVSDPNGSGTGYGICILINHGFGFETLYAHLSKMKVRSGQKVKRGDVIGFVGNTGLTQAPHLHYEVRKNGSAVNPVYYFFNDLSIEEYEKVIEKSKEDNQSLS